MILPAILDPFADGAPAAVMTRLALDWIVDGTAVDRLFEEVAEGQYLREFALSHFVQVMLDVACGYKPSPHAAFRARRLDEVASISAFYRKLDRMELAVTAAVVRQAADRAADLIVASGGLLPEPIPGYAARVLDGNILTGTEHRLKPLRGTRSAALPGMSLAIFEPASGLIRDLVLVEDAHRQERASLDRVAVGSGQLWIADRNFCIRSFLLRVARAGSRSLIRWHRSSCPFTEAGPTRSVGRCETGEVFEQPIDVEDPEQPGVYHRFRRIILELDEPTRDGETQIVLVTDLPAEVAAESCCVAYRGRWRIEGHFQKLTELLHCEIPTLGYPRAALFAFGMSAVAGHALAVLKGNLRATHGDEMAEAVSDYAVVNEVAEIYPGMMMAVPPGHWQFAGGLDAAGLAALLNDLAARLEIHRKLRSRRGPKRAGKAKKSSGHRIHHVSTKKMIDAARGGRPPRRKGRSPTRSTV
jgi:hypothetical protein